MQKKALKELSIQSFVTRLREESDTHKGAGKNDLQGKWQAKGQTDQDPFALSDPRTWDVFSSDDFCCWETYLK